jgi:DNA-binding NarL/FixJ family response regulator
VSSRVRVLLVEDDPASLANTRLLLEVEGFEVLTAPDGATGLARIEAHRPQVVVCDVMMPGVDGIELLARVRATPSIERTPFIFLTALAGQPSRVRGMNSGADDYLEKPFTPADLVGAITARLLRVSALAANPPHLAEGPGRGPTRADVEALLTRREIETFDLVGKALSTNEIAERLGISPRTVESHRGAIIGKLHLNSAAELVRVAAVLARQSRN